MVGTAKRGIEGSSRGFGFSGHLLGWVRHPGGQSKRLTDGSESGLGTPWLGLLQRRGAIFCFAGLRDWKIFLFLLIEDSARLAAKVSFPWLKLFPDAFAVGSVALHANKPHLPSVSDRATVLSHRPGRDSISLISRN
jgi:hypothetical protein